MAKKNLGKSRWLWVLAALIVAGLLVGGTWLAFSSANPPETVSHGGPVKDYVSLVDNLRGEGATVEPRRAASQPFFSGNGYLININGQDVQVFEYPNSAAAQKDASKVSVDGYAIGTSQVEWIEPPHFYKKERVIVLYLGNNAETLSWLAKLLGPQFAGK